MEDEKWQPSAVDGMIAELEIDREKLALIKRNRKKESREGISQVPGIIKLLDGKSTLWESATREDLKESLEVESAECERDHRWRIRALQAALKGRLAFGPGSLSRGR